MASPLYRFNLSLRSHVVVKWFWIALFCGIFGGSYRNVFLSGQKGMAEMGKSVN
jgi:hypothetical protein